VIVAVMNGKTIGGIQTIIDLAAESFPGKSFFGALRTTTAASPSAGNANETHISIPYSDIVDALTDALLEYAAHLTDTEPICSLIAETNASGFYPDDVSIRQLGQLDILAADFSFVADVHFAGEQDEDKMWFGHGIQATLQGTAHFNGTEWEIDDECEFLSAEVEDGSDEDED
jgi:hypothetical protein